MADQFFEDYKLRNPRSYTFAEYAVGHVKRLIGKTMADRCHRGNGQATRPTV